MKKREIIVVIIALIIAIILGISLLSNNVTKYKLFFINY
jgi:hypothetical protein